MNFFDYYRNSKIVLVMRPILTFVIMVMCISKFWEVDNLLTLIVMLVFLQDLLDETKKAYGVFVDQDEETE